MHANSSYVGPLEDDVQVPTLSISSSGTASDFDTFGRQMVELVANVRAGRQESVAELYSLVHRCAAPLITTLGSADAEDRIHDTFLIVERAIRREKVRDPASIAGFIKVLLRRQAYLAIAQRIKNRKQVPLEKLENTSALVDLTHQVLRDQQLAVIRAALQRLSKRDREILVRFYVRGEEQQVICSALQLTASQFQLRKWKAKARLTMAIQRYLSGRRARSATSPLLT